MRLLAGGVGLALALVLGEVVVRFLDLGNASMERGMFHVVRSRDIEWIEANDGGVLIHVGDKEYPARHTLTGVQSRLDPDTFLRVHRSIIVNRKRVVNAKFLWKGEYRLSLASGKTICTGRTYQAAVEEFLECA